jgi:DNA-binding response OmpR family regulator
MPQILIVDDETDVCDHLSRLFGRLGWAAHRETDPAAVYTAVRGRKPDVVLLDVSMPGMDGFAVLELIRSDPDVATTPVVMYSALDDEVTIDRALAAGADDYVVKGTPLVELRNRVSLFIARDRLPRGCRNEGGDN